MNTIKLHSYPIQCHRLQVLTIFQCKYSIFIVYTFLMCFDHILNSFIVIFYVFYLFFKIYF